MILFTRSTLETWFAAKSLDNSVNSAIDIFTSSLTITWDVTSTIQHYTHRFFSDAKKIPLDKVTKVFFLALFFFLGTRFFFPWHKFLFLAVITMFLLQGKKDAAKKAVLSLYQKEFPWRQKKILWMYTIFTTNMRGPWLLVLIDFKHAIFYYCLFYPKNSDTRRQRGVWPCILGITMMVSGGYGPEGNFGRIHPECVSSCVGLTGKSEMHRCRRKPSRRCMLKYDARIFMGIREICITPEKKRHWDGHESVVASLMSHFMISYFPVWREVLKWVQVLVCLPRWFPLSQ